MGLYVCTECAENGIDVKMPVDEIGVALMHQHLKSEHGVIATQFKDCDECGTSVLCLLGALAPTSCQEHQ